MLRSWHLNLVFKPPTINLGAIWHIGNGKDVYKKDSIAPPRDRKWHYSVILSGGLKEITPAGGPKYGIGSLNAEVIKPVSRKSRIGVGLDIFYDASIERKLKRSRGDYSGMFAAVRPGLHFHYELKIFPSSLYYLMLADTYTPAGKMMDTFMPDPEFVTVLPNMYC